MPWNWSLPSWFSRNKVAPAAAPVVTSDASVQTEALDPPSESILDTRDKRRIESKQAWNSSASKYDQSVGPTSKTLPPHIAERLRNYKLRFRKHPIKPVEPVAPSTSIDSESSIHTLAELNKVAVNQFPSESPSNDHVQKPVMPTNNSDHNDAIKRAFAKVPVSEAWLDIYDSDDNPVVSARTNSCDSDISQMRPAQTQETLDRNRSGASADLSLDVLPLADPFFGPVYRTLEDGIPSTNSCASVNAAREHRQDSTNQFLNGSSSSKLPIPRSEIGFSNSGLEEGYASDDPSLLPTGSVTERFLDLRNRDRLQNFGAGLGSAQAQPTSPSSTTTSVVTPPSEGTTKFMSHQAPGKVIQR